MVKDYKCMFTLFTVRGNTRWNCHGTKKPQGNESVPERGPDTEERGDCEESKIPQKE